MIKFYFHPSPNPLKIALYLEETGGYLPMKRVQTVGGLARFKVGALGLKAGDAFKVKVGLRNFSGMLDVPFEVVA